MDHRVAGRSRPPSMLLADRSAQGLRVPVPDGGVVRRPRLPDLTCAAWALRRVRRRPRRTGTRSSGTGRRSGPRGGSCRRRAGRRRRRPPGGGRGGSSRGCCSRGPAAPRTAGSRLRSRHAQQAIATVVRQDEPTAGAGACRWRGPLVGRTHRRSWHATAAQRRTLSSWTAQAAHAALVHSWMRSASSCGVVAARTSAAVTAPRSAGDGR